MYLSTNVKVVNESKVNIGSQSGWYRPLGTIEKSAGGGKRVGGNRMALGAVNFFSIKKMNDKVCQIIRYIFNFNIVVYVSHGIASLKMFAYFNMKNSRL